MYCHPNSIGPDPAPPEDYDGPQTPEEAGEERKDELDAMMVKAGDLSREWRNPADRAELVEAIDEFAGFAPNGAALTANALIDAVSAAMRMDNTGAARAVLEWFKLIKDNEATRAETARQIELDRMEVAE